MFSSKDNRRHLCVFVEPPALFEVCISLYNIFCVWGEKAGQDLLIGQCMFQSPLSE